MRVGGTGFLHSCPVRLCPGWCQVWSLLSPCWARSADKGADGLTGSLAHLSCHAYEWVRQVWNLRGWPLLSHSPPSLGCGPSMGRPWSGVHACPHRWFLHTRALCVNQDSCISEASRVTVREIPGQLFVGGLSPYGGGLYLQVFVRGRLL